jgi:hypothetical protein
MHLAFDSDLGTRKRDHMLRNIGDMRPVRVCAVGH